MTWSGDLDHLVVARLCRDENGVRKGALGERGCQDDRQHERRGQAGQARRLRVRRIDAEARPDPPASRHWTMCTRQLYPSGEERDAGAGAAAEVSGNGGAGWSRLSPTAGRVAPGFGGSPASGRVPDARAPSGAPQDVGWLVRPRGWWGARSRLATPVAPESRARARRAVRASARMRSGAGLGGLPTVPRRAPRPRAAGRACPSSEPPGELFDQPQDRSCEPDRDEGEGHLDEQADQEHRNQLDRRRRRGAVRRGLGERVGGEAEHGRDTEEPGLTGPSVRSTAFRRPLPSRSPRPESGTGRATSGDTRSTRRDRPRARRGGHRLAARLCRGERAAAQIGRAPPEGSARPPRRHPTMRRS